MIGKPVPERLMLWTAAENSWDSEFETCTAAFDTHGHTERISVRVLAYFHLKQPMSVYRSYECSFTLMR